MGQVPISLHTIMKKNKVFQRLKRARKFAQGNTQTDYLLVHKDDAQPNIGSLEFRGAVQKEINDLFVQSLTEKINKIRDGKLDLRRLDISNTNLDEPIVQCESISKFPDSELFQTLVSKKDYPNTKIDLDDKPDFQLLRVTDGDKVLIGVQNSQSIKAYGKSDGLPVLYNNDVYTKFDGDVFIVPQSINAVCFDGLVYVFTPKSFEKMFEMRDEYERQANQVIEKFGNAGIKLANEKVRDEWLVGEIRILRKMFEVSQNEIAHHATPNKIKQVIEKYGVDVEYTKKNGDIELEINRYQDIWELLRLLNADYAEAEIIPDGKLEINQKRFIQ